MLTLSGKNINLRPLEPEDLEFIYEIENNEDLWELSSTQTPYSRFLIKQYLDNAHRDIYEVKQLRLVIETKEEERLGLIDIFDFDPQHRRAAIGILIVEKENRGKGFGAEALKLLCDYSFERLKLHQLYANVAEENLKSQKLFRNMNFQQIGIKKDWNLVNGNYKNEILYQLINNVY
ncbi:MULTISPECIES: GNAT family N-acetyltransferase [Mesonia]|uniref:Spermidine N(1)-acetyltransferase n=1 Tax=Mesonia oceanica TaxID=2687242 RepID=A0AC61YB96_9FLAO|nr:MULTISPECIES: GNAT family N-acetyltransferase [Mesonia]MAN26391.1 GNAT family N-acetyltransferase [Mesonia sp.]MAQ41772.1 GNAT family N-acetyltransferase [Mesonia sp.]MBJ98282.1 GNAT family N-acetyltransferase [Flavobacteriaceae bacterium]VVV01716.1 Spermidine N(1)-acetyltransferase [Mesonia oceanica]|tara:strand:- start:3424 stop:3954 length:531 start_codon:yes stop_codon:yes gene_type:complete